MLLNRISSNIFNFFFNAWITLALIFADGDAFMFEQISS